MLEKCSKCSAYEYCKKLQVDFSLVDRDLELLDVLGGEIIPAGSQSKDNSINVCWEMIKKYTNDPVERVKMAYFAFGVEFVFQAQIKNARKEDKDMSYV